MGKKEKVDYVALVQSKEFKEAKDDAKFLHLAGTLNDLQARQEKSERQISDVSHQYSKFCLTMRGSGMPEVGKNEDTVGMWIVGMKEKYGISITEEERAQFRACHRQPDGGLVACFTSTVRGSVFDRCSFRGSVDGRPSN